MDIDKQHTKAVLRLHDACILLAECRRLLVLHHEAKVARWFDKTSRCPVCSHNGTQQYPDDIFGRIDAFQKQFPNRH